MSGNLVVVASSLSEVVRLVSASAAPGSMRTRVIAVDGQGGAGKSTFGRLLADALGGAPIVQTDDFASWDHPIDWWPRLLDQVLEPLSRNWPARYQRYDWETRRLAEWHEVAVGGFVVLEGVSASRQAFGPHLSFRIWIDTPREVRLRRGLERDGAEASEQWQEWMAAEDEYVARERPDLAADLMISGRGPWTFGAAGAKVASVNELPTWEQRIRSPQLLPWSLLGDAVTWAGATSDRGVLLASPSGRTEVFAFDAAVAPATLTQITDRPQGTMGASVSWDGSVAYWLDDTAGDELGRWKATPVSGGSPLTLLPALPPSYPGGIVPLADGRVAVGRLLDSQPGVDVGFEIALASGADGSGDVAYRCADPAQLIDVSHDAALALVTFAPGGNWLRLGVRVVRLSDGTVANELVDDGHSLSPVAFHPSEPRIVLLGHERRDFQTTAIWDRDSGDQTDVVTSFQGDVTASWYPDGSALLLTVLRDARHELYRYDRSTGESSRIETPAGTISRSSARPDGSVHFLLSRSDLPVSLIRSREGGTSDLVNLEGATPAPTVAATSVRVDVPQGRIHALVTEPAGRSRPHPTLFVPHGGPTAQDFDAWNDVVAAYVDAGYAVVRVNYRGSTGFGAAWRDALHERLGFIELEDIGAVREHLEASGVIDPGRVAITGGSWGGFLTLMAVGTEPDRWRSGAALVPLADQFTAAEDSPSFMKAYDAALMGGTIEEIPDAYRAASPITYVDDVTAPLLITAGENDPRCPVRQVDTYVERLRSRGHDVQYERVATGHGFADLDIKIDEVRMILAFFARTLPVDPV